LQKYDFLNFKLLKIAIFREVILNLSSFLRNINIEFEISNVCQIVQKLPQKTFARFNAFSQNYGFIEDNKRWITYNATKKVNWRKPFTTLCDRFISKDLTFNRFIEKKKSKKDVGIKIVSNVPPLHVWYNI